MKKFSFALEDELWGPVVPLPDDLIAFLRRRGWRPCGGRRGSWKTLIFVHPDPEKRSEANAVHVSDEGRDPDYAYNVDHQVLMEVAAIEHVAPESLAEDLRAEMRARRAEGLVHYALAHDTEQCLLCKVTR